MSAACPNCGHALAKTNRGWWWCSRCERRMRLKDSVGGSALPTPGAARPTSLTPTDTAATNDFKCPQPSGESVAARDKSDRRRSGIPQEGRTDALPAGVQAGPTPSHSTGVGHQSTAAMTHDQRNQLRHLIDQAKRRQLANHEPPPGRNQAARSATYRAYYERNRARILARRAASRAA